MKGNETPTKMNNNTNILNTQYSIIDSEKCMTIAETCNEKSDENDD